MKAIETIFPVFFMILIWLISRIKGWTTPEQKEGANKIVFTILFPIMIFNVLSTSHIEAQAISIVIYVLSAFSIALVIGFLARNITGKKWAHFSPFYMTTNEGGNVALPLYTSIVGMAYAKNTVIFDIAGTIMCFIIIPICIEKMTSETADIKVLLKKILSNSFVIAVALGLLLNFTGCYNYLMTTSFGTVYTKSIAQVTAPIVSMILFVIGYNLKIKKDMINSLIKLLGIRFIVYSFIIAGFFVFFPSLMQDKTYLMAVLIYYMSPTSFAMPMIVEKLNKSEEDADFQSAVLSLGMIITLIVYTVVVLFIA